jgi:hypothetical protein
MTGAGASESKDLRIDIRIGCSPADRNSNMRIEWDKGNRFVLDSVSAVVCYDDAQIGPKPGDVQFDTMQGAGVGQLNNTAATVAWKFTDGGARNDRMTVIVRIGSQIVLSYSGPVVNGNLQSHKN